MIPVIHICFPVPTILFSHDRLNILYMKKNSTCTSISEEYQNKKLETNDRKVEGCVQAVWCGAWREWCGISLTWRVHVCACVLWCGVVCVIAVHGVVFCVVCCMVWCYVMWHLIFHAGLRVCSVCMCVPWCFYIYVCLYRWRERECVKLLVNGTWTWQKTVFILKLLQYLPFLLIHSSISNSSSTALKEQCNCMLFSSHGGIVLNFTPLTFHTYAKNTRSWVALSH